MYYQTSWVVVTLNEAYILTSLETFLYPFASNTWYLLAVVISFALGMVALVKRIFPQTLFKNSDHAGLDLIAMMLGIPAQCRPAFLSNRILNATWMMYSLILRTIYQALLFHVLRTNVMRNMPETLEELVLQNYSLIVQKSSYVVMQKVPLFQYVDFITLNTTEETMPLVYLEELPLNKARCTAAALPLIFYNHYAAKNYKVDIFRVIPQSIMHLKMGIFLSKHSFLIEQFDEILMLLRGYGLMEAWHRQEVDVNYVKNERKSIEHLIDLKQLEILFKLLIFGYILAICIFIVELVFVKFKKNRIYPAEITAYQ